MAATLTLPDSLTPVTRACYLRQQPVVEFNMSVPDTGSASTVATVAQRYLETLRARGVERLFFNAGTDFAPLVEAYARNAEANAPPFPEPILATHENLAIGMAHGAYLVTGRAQAVMVHVSVGTANAICGLMNAARDRIPILLTAGRSPVLESGALGARDLRIHWGQEMFDQAGMVRELVKWDYELRDARQVTAVVDRAVTIASTEPKGPIYLTLPRELLAAAAPPRAALPSLSVPSPAAPAPDAVENLAQRIAAAAMPVIVSTASGADRDTVAPLVALCERHGIGYVEEQARYLNFPAGHPLHLGYQLAPVFAAADVLCFLECDVPWLPDGAAPGLEAFVVHAGIDPLYSRYPIRGHRADLAVTTSSGAFIAALDAALGALGGGDAARRRDRVTALAARLRGAASPRAAADAALTRDDVADSLAQALDADTIVFNEYWAPPARLARTLPQTYFYLSSAGGLGWALPAALGAQLAAPQRTVVALIGDGAYLFANPAACHHVAARHALPVLTVVYNNARWGAVDGATRSVYPDGQWRAGHGPSLSDLEPMPALERYVEASGGLGLRVETQAELDEALQRALRAVRIQRRQALINVIGA
jgi:acetolactate synthase-1/2/3 large subunit